MRLPHMANRNCLAVVVLTSVLGTAAAESPLTSLKVYPRTSISRRLATPVVHRPGVVRRWAVARCHRRSEGDDRESSDCQTRRKRLVSRRRRRDRDDVAYGGKSVKLPVKVKDAKADRPISFKLDVMPVFMRTGCNIGSCHGAARGKDGFRLSLFGFDPDGDHYRLTREISGRRINLAVPAREPVDRKVHRQRAAHRRQALQGRRRILQHAHPLARRRRPPTTPRRAQRRFGRALPEAGRARRQGRHAANDRAARSTPTAPTAT